MAKTAEVYVFDEDTKNNWWTGITVGVLALLFAVLIGVMGVIDLMRSVRRFKNGFFAGLLTAVLGLLEIGVSVYLLNRVGTGIPTATLGLIVAISLIVRGIVGIVLAFDSEVSSGTRWLSGIVGAAAILAGLVIVWYPVAGAVAWVWVLGLFALVTGAIEIATGFMLRTH
jgi:uncharacterized membrane protein HdeD (DUF308 family)